MTEKEIWSKIVEEANSILESERLSESYLKKFVIDFETLSEVIAYKISNDLGNKDYDEISELILFDGKGYEKSIEFDHDLLKFIPNSVNKMIAGNIKIEDIPDFKKKDYYIDLSGSLENEEGKKDLNKINKLLNIAIKNEA